MALLETMKDRLRLSSDDLNDEITANISACEAELQRVGITYDETSALIIKAVELYIKWQWDYLGKGEKFEKNFCDLRDALSLCAAYTTATEGD